MIQDEFLLDGHAFGERNDENFRFAYALYGLVFVERPEIAAAFYGFDLQSFLDINAKARSVVINEVQERMKVGYPGSNLTGANLESEQEQKNRLLETITKRPYIFIRYKEENGLGRSLGQAYERTGWLQRYFNQKNSLPSLLL